MSLQINVFKFKGTIEEKIYQRQLSKQCLSGSVLNPSTKGKLKFSHDELKDLFAFHEDSECLTHDLINCDCMKYNCENVPNNNKQKLAPQNVGMEELMNWHHMCGPINQNNTTDLMLASGGTDITFCLQII
ncbi:DNA repair and recombination protein RAD54B [Caerostris extrusa]|uniref:DNA repair and recombination protein RAD54B n=1 Tax=Caerostris extrusa TaxID=172846 RepID=A0AAV4MHC4_CAEEX|nr:DNA repair and recombination protein RAD54B [Caerostris extrusa]